MRCSAHRAILALVDEGQRGRGVEAGASIGRPVELFDCLFVCLVTAAMQVLAGLAVESSAR